MCRAGPFEWQPQRASQAPWRFPASLFSGPKFSGNDHQSIFGKAGGNEFVFAFRRSLRLVSQHEHFDHTHLAAQRIGSESKGGKGGRKSLRKATLKGPQ